MQFYTKQSKINKTILLDSGHGFIINSVYQTSGKRSPRWPDGSILYEGECNKQIKARLMEMLQAENIPFVDINPESTDVSLSERVKRANKYENSLYISIHSNAGGGTGCELFTSVNCSKASTALAKEIEAQYKPHFEGERWRGIKKKDFYVVKNTAMPAVLVESFFMDTERECKKYLMTRAGRDRIALWIFTGLKNYLKSL